MLDFIKVIIISDNKWVNVKVLAVRAELNSVCGLVKIECNMNCASAQFMCITFYGTVIWICLANLYSLLLGILIMSL